MDMEKRTTMKIAKRAAMVAVNNNRNDIIIMMTLNFLTIVNLCRQNCLIFDDVYEMLIEPTTQLTPRQKASTLVNNIYKRISIDPNYFEKFISVLLTANSQDLADKLTNNYTYERNKPFEGNLLTTLYQIVLVL
jgi:hypothetical protein